MSTQGQELAPVHPLRRPKFVLLWLAAFATQLTQWQLLIAMPLYALGLTGSALVTSTVAMLGLLPSLLLAPIAGLFADRFNPPRLLVYLSAVHAVSLLPLLFVHDAKRLWIVYLVMAADSGLTVMFESVKNVIVPELVDASQVVTANGTISLAENLGRLAGSPLGGFVLAFAGINGVVVGSAMPLVLAAGLVLVVSVGWAQRARVEAAVAWGRQFVAGLRTIWSSDRLRGCASVVALMSISQGMFAILFLLFVTRLLHGGDSVVGLLRGVQAVGGLIGGALLGGIVRGFHMDRIVSRGLFLFGIMGLAIYNSSFVTTNIAVYIVLFTLAGAPGVWVMAGWLSVVQDATPGDLRGRVMSVFLALFDGIQAVGMLLAGVLVTYLPTVWLLNVQSGLMIVAAVLAARSLTAVG